MLYGRAHAFWTLAVVTLLTLPAVAQSVISTRSGVVHFSEGAVYLGGQPLVYHPGKFSSVPEGGELRSANGRAEVLLTPGVFLRIGDRSAIRMQANKLSDTRVELLAGSAVVDSAEPTSGTSVTLIYKNWSVRFPQQGVYRVDSDPPRLSVLRGKAEVTADASKGWLSVEQGKYVPFAPVLVTERTTDPPHDALSSWAEGRHESISADNAIAANIQDPASLSTTNSVDNFTYFPMLGLPSSPTSSMGTGLSSYDNSLDLYQPGFNALYLPGYTYLPLIMFVGPSAFPTSHLPPHAGVVVPFGTPHTPIPRPLGPRALGVTPIPPRTMPMHPLSPRSVPMGPAPRVGIHGGVHR